MIGKVRMFDRQRGFGFVENEGGSWFFHESQVTGQICRGDTVRFWLSEDPRGRLAAVEVQRVIGE